MSNFRPSPVSPRRTGPAALLCRLCCCWAFLSGLPEGAASAQPVDAPEPVAEPSPLRTFGYFQNSFQHQWDYRRDESTNTFLAQQLNLFFQKDLNKRWTALVDFEIVNNFSTTRQWGAMNLEEAWVRYRASRQFNVKAGLHIPPFNNLNEIKNRTPLLPYIIRPYIYETSLGEAVDTEGFLPARAFGQVYGFFPLGAAKLDYGVYVGNSPNVNDRRDRGQTGADTSHTFLVGGRVGVRYGELKAGVSAARDHPNLTPPHLIELPDARPEDFEHATRTRLGADLSYTLGRLYLETEFLYLRYTKDALALRADASFWYATLGVYATERLFAYASFWLEYERHRFAGQRLEARVHIPTGGVSYTVNDLVTLKAQYAYVDIDTEGTSFFPETFGHFSTAVSVVF